MIGLQKAIAERCKKSGVIPEIIDGMSAYKDHWASEKKIIHTAFPLLLDLPQELSSGDVQSNGRNKTLWDERIGSEELWM